MTTLPVDMRRGGFKHMPMQYVLTLAAATIEAFPVETGEAVHAALVAAGADTQRLHWLGPAACDIVFDGIDPIEAETIAHGIIGDAEIDVLRRKSPPAASACWSPTWNRP